MFENIPVVLIFVYPWTIATQLLLNTIFRLMLHIPFIRLRLFMHAHPAYRLVWCLVATVRLLICTGLIDLIFSWQEVEKRCVHILFVVCEVWTDETYTYYNAVIWEAFSFLKAVRIHEHRNLGDLIWLSLSLHEVFLCFVLGLCDEWEYFLFVWKCESIARRRCCCFDRGCLDETCAECKKYVYECVSLVYIP